MYIYYTRPPNLSRPRVSCMFVRVGFNCFRRAVFNLMMPAGKRSLAERPIGVRGARVVVLYIRPLECLCCAHGVNGTFKGPPRREFI